MSRRILGHVFLLSCFLISGLSDTRKPLDGHQKLLVLSSEGRKLISDSTRDASPTVHVINPTTPTTTDPIITNPIMPPLPIPGGPNTGTTSGALSGRTFCIARPSASETALQVALDYACGFGADCSALQVGGSCYNPNSVKDHASYAFNSYYQRNPAPTSCNFGGTAMTTMTDPSSESCPYPSSGTNSSFSPPTVPPQTQTFGTSANTPPAPTYDGSITPPGQFDGSVTPPGPFGGSIGPPRAFDGSVPEPPRPANCASFISNVLYLFALLCLIPLTFHF